MTPLPDAHRDFAQMVHRHVTAIVAAPNSRQSHQAIESRAANRAAARPLPSIAGSRSLFGSFFNIPSARHRLDNLPQIRSVFLGRLEQFVGRTTGLRAQSTRSMQRRTARRDATIPLDTICFQKRRNGPGQIGHTPFPSGHLGHDRFRCHPLQIDFRTLQCLGPDLDRGGVKTTIGSISCKSGSRSIRNSGLISARGPDPDVDKQQAARLPGRADDVTCVNSHCGREIRYVWPIKTARDTTEQVPRNHQLAGISE